MNPRKSLLKFKNKKMNQIIQWSQGNPGAMAFLMSIMQPENVVKRLIIFQKLEEAKSIRGTNLYVLWSDLCNRDMACLDEDDEEQLTEDYGWNWRGNEKLIAYGEGFHFFTEKQDAEIRMRRWRGVELREFIVPKGARYMTDRGLGICDKIMMK